MEKAQAERWLELLMELTTNKNKSVDRLAEDYAVSTRTIYRYIKTMRDVGFEIKSKGNNVYYIDKKSEFFNNIGDVAHFNKDEVCILMKAIDNIEENSIVSYLKKKLSDIYDIDLLADVTVNTNRQKNIEKLTKAIENQLQVTLKDYHSGHSDTVSDRVVEPYQFTDNFVSIGCYEPSSQSVKIFKVSRIGDVIPLKNWLYPAKHLPIHEDVFRMSGTKKYHVILDLNVRAVSLLRENYPKSDDYLTQTDKNHWRFESDVCSMLGIGRFVLGLFEDIQIVDSPELEKYVRKKVREMRKKCQMMRKGNKGE